MEASEREELEAEIRRLCERGDLESAATAAMRGYGPQIFGFLVATHRSEQEAGDVFSLFSEHLWKGIGRFAWQCSFRTWAYTLAKNAGHHHRKVARRAARNVPLSGCSSLAELEVQVRSATLTYLRTQTKNKVAELRDSLSEEDRELLVLRIDRKLAWNDLARVFLVTDGSTPSADALKKESARLRKRFQLVKEKLLALGREQGIIGSGEDSR